PQAFLPVFFLAAPLAKLPADHFCYHCRMMRRTFLAAATTAPAALRASTEKRGHTYAEVEKILAKGDVKGKLTRDDLPTPALMLDLDAFEFNIAKMTNYCKDHNRALRPHGKTHKCPEIAKALIREGAV